MIERGITNCKADYWTHVCPKSSEIYVYTTTAMREFLKRTAKEGPMAQPSGPRPSWPVSEFKEIKTARGYVVPCVQTFIRTAVIPETWLRNFDACSSDEECGSMAEMAVMYACNGALFPVPLGVDKITDLKEQYELGDFRLHTVQGLVIEVKADWPGGRNGTGNLFVQTHEGGHKWKQRNAHKQAWHSAP